MGTRKAMKLISVFVAFCVAKSKRYNTLPDGPVESLIVGVEQGECGGKMCGYARASSLCMEIDEAAIEYFGAKVGALGSHKCVCIFQHRWHVSQGRHFKVVGSKTPECGFQPLQKYDAINKLTLVEGDEVTLANEENSG